MRSIYEIRERPSRMYSWTALVTSQLTTELPWNIAGSAILFFTWFWTVGFDSSRAGYTFLMMAFVFPLYYTTIGQVGDPLLLVHSVRSRFGSGYCCHVTKRRDRGTLVLVLVLFRYYIVCLTVSRGCRRRLMTPITVMVYCNHLEN